MASTLDAALKEEIARLAGMIKRHKLEGTSWVTAPSVAGRGFQPLSTTRDVVIDGVLFESSRSSLVRKDLPKPAGTSVNPPPGWRAQEYTTKKVTGHRIPAGRTYKPKVSPRTRQPRTHNMTLDNTRTQLRKRRSQKRMKYVDKPCPRFTTTGTCSRGLTCQYQHDPDKVAVCWNFLHGNCSNTSESCNLSHDPTPERTPLCVHFANNGRCTRKSCPFPHVRVGQRHGVCRDFAVLGYCARGLDCEMQHVRECPDFAEKGNCSTKGCKLPHVIRANRNRKAPASISTIPTVAGTSSSVPESSTTAAASSTTASDLSTDAGATASLKHDSLNDAQLGDEFISLVFNESDEEDDEDEDDSTDEPATEEEAPIQPSLSAVSI